MKPIEEGRVKTMKRSLMVLLVFGMLPWTGLNAQQTETTVFRVSAKVAESCEVAARDFALDNYAARTGAPRQARALLRATCTPNTTYSLGLNMGVSPAATINHVPGAQLSNPGNMAAAGAVIGVGTGLEVDHTVFGGIPGTQIVPAGDYADTITLRVYY
jgi:spore coat protein U-like protein